jgi:transposase
VITLEDWQTIRHLAAAGHSQRAIARIVKRSRKAVAHALKDDSPPVYEREPFRKVALEGFRAVVEQGLEAGLCGSRMLCSLRGSGYGGSDATFYRWLAQVRKERSAEQGSCRFETGPGEQAQFDWSPYTLRIGGSQLRVLVYALLLGYSRRVHWYPSLSEKQDSVLEAIEAGWRHFGGACRYLLTDNAKSMVLRHRRSEVRWNSQFLALCGHYRVQPIAATPGHPQTKGKVENPFRVLENRFLKGSEWRDFDHLTEDLARFEAQWEQREHQTTRVAPSARFEEERPRLLALPREPFLGCLHHLREVSLDGLFSFDGTRYCVPVHLGLTQVRVRSRQGREIVVYHPKGEEVIRHPLMPRGSAPQLRPECYENCQRRRRACLLGLLAEFRRRFEAAAVAELYLRRLLSRHPNHPEDALGRVLALLETVPDAVALMAIADAIEYNLLDPKYLPDFLSRYLRPAQAIGAACPQPPYQPSASQPLPALDVERTLDGFAALLPTLRKEMKP